MVRGPFPPQHQGLGGTPSVWPDLWINCVFLPLFTILGILHFSLFLYNKNKRGILFPFNAATMGFCATRTIATSLRIAWVYQPRNIHLAMTAQIFVYAGVIILILSNLWWTVRIIRAMHPRAGWSKPITALIPVPIILSVAMIICLIISVCIMFYLPDAFSQLVARRIQQTGGTMFALWTILPFPLLLTSILARSYPSLRNSYTDNFGCRTAAFGIPNTIPLKILVCTITGTLLASGACFRCVTNFLGPIGIRDPTPWYFEKQYFYIFNFTLELITIAFWLLIRVDKIFNTPNKSKGPQSYGNQSIHPGEDGGQTSKRIYNSHTNLLSDDEGPSSHYRNSTSTNLRDSMATMPPVGSLSRRSSWGHQVRSFIAPEDFTLKDLEKLDSSSSVAAHNRGLSWGGYSQTVVGGGSSHHGDQSPTVNYSLPFVASTDNLSLPPKIRSASANVSGTTTPTGQDEFVPEMGFDPMSGKWVKPRSSQARYASMPILRSEVERSRPVSGRSYVTADEEK